VNRAERLEMYGPEVMDEYRRAQLRSYPHVGCLLGALIVGAIAKPSFHTVGRSWPYLVLIGLFLAASWIFAVRYCVAMMRCWRHARSRRLTYKAARLDGPEDSRSV
jgi:hypothetical protein